MKKLFLTSMIALLMGPAFAYDGMFRITVNSIKDDEFEFDEIGVWLKNCEIIVTIHLNPDSILDCYEQEGYMTVMMRFGYMYAMEAATMQKDSDG